MSIPVVSNTMRQHGFSIKPVDMPHSAVRSQVSRPYVIFHDEEIIGYMGQRDSEYWVGWPSDGWDRPMMSKKTTFDDPNSVINMVAYSHKLSVVGVCPF